MILEYFLIYFLTVFCLSIIVLVPFIIILTLIAFVDFSLKSMKSSKKDT